MSDTPPADDVREALRLADALTNVYQPRMIDSQAAALLRRFAAEVRPHGTVTDAEVKAAHRAWTEAPRGVQGLALVRQMLEAAREAEK